MQASIRRVVKSNGTSTETILSERKFVPTKASAGSAFSIKLQAAGTDSVKLTATVTVGTGTPLVLTATDSSSANRARAGTAAGWAYLSTSTPRIALAPATVESTGHPRAGYPPPRRRLPRRRRRHPTPTPDTRADAHARADAGTRAVEPRACSWRLPGCRPRRVCPRAPS